jgi:hypothetical protein
MNIRYFLYDIKDEVPIYSLHILSDEEQEWSKIETCRFHMYISYICFIYLISIEWAIWIKIRLV